MAFDPNYHQAGDDINNLDLVGYKKLTDAATDVTSRLAADPALRTTLEAGRTPERASRSRRAAAKRSEYLGSRLAR